jgi:Lrp/AsnC family leucine-responsive transcriptional regulator
LESERLLDDVGWQILRELQGNARLGFTELGRRVGLTPPAVAERVRRMEEAGIIAGYRLDLNLERLGFPMQAIIRMSATSVGCTRLSAIARDWPEVLECHRVTGSDSLIMRVAVRSVQALEAFIDRITPYGTTTTSLVLSTPVSSRAIEPPARAERPNHADRAAQAAST